MDCPQCGHVNTAEARFCARCGAGLEIHISEDRSAYNTPVAPGTIFEGKYQVLEEIGRGGMGVVYRGHDLSLDRLVAIKVLPEQFNTDDEVIARFKREARAMAALDHPNVVPVYAIGQQRMFHYFVMKFLEGATVAELLERKRKTDDPQFRPERVRRTVMQVCLGLGHAHKRGLIHRDIKPGNIMLSPDGHVTIMDFGIVKEATGGEALTRTGLVFGTPEYMAPEQAQGQTAPSPQTDLYSLGVVAYEMLSGVPPFKGDTPFSVVLKHIKSPPAPLVEELPEVSLDLQDVVFRALEKKPSDRWPSAQAMHDALADIDFNRPSAVRTRTSVVSLPPPKVDDVPLEPPRPSAPSRPLPPPPPPSRPPPPPLPSVGEINAEPPPGNIPARAPVEAPKPPPAPAARPVRVAAAPRNAPVAPPRDTSPAMVDDRPGHYRQMLTARDRKQHEKTRRRTRVLGVAVGVVFLVGIALIVFSLTRSDAAQEPPAPAADAALAVAEEVEGDVGAAPAVPDGPVSRNLVTEPPGAQVFEIGRAVPSGRTPLLVHGPRGSQRDFVLKAEGFSDKRVSVGFSTGADLSIRLDPLPAP
ncbi:MAG: protein kinase [Myxococcales bacterium]|nr:protein kinase [Myxococcales bacterium]